MFRNAFLEWAAVGVIVLVVCVLLFSPGPWVARNSGAREAVFSALRRLDQIDRANWPVPPKSDDTGNELILVPGYETRVSWHFPGEGRRQIVFNAYRLGRRMTGNASTDIVAVMLPLAPPHEPPPHQEFGEWFEESQWNIGACVVLENGNRLWLSQNQLKREMQNVNTHRPKLRKEE